MRTTIDLPDELLRQAKARATLAGMGLRDLIEKGLRLALALPPTPAPSRRVTFPPHRGRQPGILTTETVRLAEEQAQLGKTPPMPTLCDINGLLTLVTDRHVHHAATVSWLDSVAAGEAVRRH